MNLLMVAPLCDSRGKVRYSIGAQIDVSGLVKECSGFDSLKRLTVLSDSKGNNDSDEAGDAYDKVFPKKDEFQELSEMFNMLELDTVRRCGGRMHRKYDEEPYENANNTNNWNKTRILLQDSSSPDGTKNYNPLGARVGGRLGGVYEHYLLVRPYPSLRILFASPSLRVPGILQSPFMARIGGSSRIKEELTKALADGQGVTAKIRWVNKQDPEGRSRWIHCTPLLGHNRAVGVWMIVLVDDENDPLTKAFRLAPPVDPMIGRTRSLKSGNEEYAVSIMNGSKGNESLHASISDRPPTSFSVRSDLTL